MESPEKVYLIDTNVILRYLLEDHETFSPKAEAFMLKVSNGKIKAEILAVVVIECIFVLEKFYVVPRNEIVDTISRILNFTGTVITNKSEILEALLKYQSSNADIVDCILAALSSKEKPVISFDKDLEKLKAVTITL